MTSSVVDSNVGTLLKEKAFTDVQDLWDAEIVDYVVIHKPFQSISDNSNLGFGIPYTVKGNILFRPNSESALAYQLFKKNVHARVPGTPHNTPFQPGLNMAYKGLEWAADNVLPKLMRGIPNVVRDITSVLPFKFATD